MKLDSPLCCLPVVRKRMDGVAQGGKLRGGNKGCINVHEGKTGKKLQQKITEGGMNWSNRKQVMEGDREGRKQRQEGRRKGSRGTDSRPRADG